MAEWRFVMRMALIGLGGMGNCHLNVYNQLNDIKVTAVVDVDTDRVSKKLAGTDIKLYKDVDEMLDNEDVDFVDICTPSYLHEEHSIKALKRGIHVICEKPMTLSKESADRILKVASETKAIFMVAHVIRFWPEYIYLKECYDKKTFGKLFHADFSRIGEIPRWSFENWMMDPTRSGRVPLDLHIHDVDFILYFLGEPKAMSSKSIEDTDKISYIRTNFEYEDCYVSAEGGWYGNPIKFTMEFRAAFESAILEYKNRVLTVYEYGKEPYTVSMEEDKMLDSGINISSTNGYKNEICYFIDCIRNGDKPDITTPESSAKSIEVIETALKASKLGQKIEAR